jgi:uridine kinase
VGESHRALIVGVAGGSGSGKSTVALAIARALGPSAAAVIDMDAYYRDFADLSPEELRTVNWDHPESLDLARLADDLERLAAGSTIDKPRYDFARHRRMADAEIVEPRPVVIVEGILLFVDARVRAACEMKVYVDAEADLRLIRRLRRDMRERARPLDEILEQYLTTVRPMHEEFVEPSKRWADIIVPRGGHNEMAIQMLVTNIQRRLPVQVGA